MPARRMSLVSTRKKGYNPLAYKTKKRTQSTRKPRIGTITPGE
jgi:hypothetical protein